jgi:glutamate 5-kinase
MKSKRDFGHVKRLIVKIGSSTVTTMDMAEMAHQIAQLREGGVEVILVSSGAVAVGMEVLGTCVRPGTIPKLQALAALGQAELIGRYQHHLGKHSLRCAQVLLTHESLAKREHFLNIRHTLKEAIALGTIPIVNENDTVAVEELRFGDNDRLAAALSSVVDADLVILLSDVDALYGSDPKSDPKARRISEIEVDDAFLETVSESSSTAIGTGGMASKVAAARLCCEGGIGLVLARGDEPGIIATILGGADVGTYFPPRTKRADRRRHWIAFLSKLSGTITIDEGAERALLKGGSSLLAVGVTHSEGDFRRGDAVRVLTGGGG